MKLTQADRSFIIVSIMKMLEVGRVHTSGLITFSKAEIGKDLNENLSEELKKAYNRFGDDSGPAGFIRMCLIKRYLENNSPANFKSPRKLIEMSGFADALKVAEDVVSQFESLPRQYRCIVECPSDFSRLFFKEDLSLVLSQRLSIVSGSLLSREVVTSSGNIGYDNFARITHSDDAEFSIDGNKLYFVFRSSGSVVDRYTNRVSRDFFDEIRAFFGACSAFSILFDLSFGFDETESFVLINAIKEDSSEFVFLISPDADIKRVCGAMTSTDVDRMAKGGAELREVLAPVIKLLQCNDRERLSIAATWLLRAALSDRAMDRVLESSIAIEVMLGDSDGGERGGLSKLIGNRCAYALGKSNAERKQLWEFFTKFYKVRSEIVHSGRFKVSDEDSAVVENGLELAYRILRHEVDMSG